MNEYSMHKEESNKKDLKIIIVILSVAIVGFVLRIHYTPFGLPITLDGLAYFLYANDLSILGSFPEGHNFPNNGWPTFLSAFFFLISSNNFLDYMDFQRILSEIISVSTIIPLYFLCRRFVGKFYSIIGCALFVLEPRIIINSTLGITESLYIFLGVSALALFLSNNTKLVYVSFALAALFALVRYEGLLLIFPLTIVFFMKNRKKKKIFRKYFIALGIFILILLPMMSIRIETMGNDGVVSHVVYGARSHFVIAERGESDGNYYYSVLVDLTKNGISYLGWIMIPMFIWSIPLSVFLFYKRKCFRNLNHEKWLIILFSLVMIIPALYAFSREYQETRYLFFLFPIFSLVSYYAIREFEKIIPNRKVLGIILLCFMIGLSIVYLENKGLDINQAKEQHQLAKLISEKSDGINPYSGQEYIKIEQISNSGFPVLKSEIIEKPKIIPIGDTKSLSDFIQEGRDKQLTHIIVENHSELQPKFISKLYSEHEKVSYLDVELESKDLGFKKELMLLRIDYEIFDSEQKDFQ